MKFKDHQGGWGLQLSEKKKTTSEDSNALMKSDKLKLQICPQTTI